MSVTKYNQPVTAHTYQDFGDVVAIIDCKEGMSLTNSIEFWIRQISKNNVFKPEDRKWIYRDTTDVWDGYDFTKKEFIAIGTTEFPVALATIRGEMHIKLSQNHFR